MLGPTCQRRLPVVLVAGMVAAGIMSLSGASAKADLPQLPPPPSPAPPSVPAQASSPSLPVPSVPGAPLPLTPAVAAQSATPAPPCTMAPLRVGQFQVLFDAYDQGIPVPAAVDPWTPCRVYRVSSYAATVNGSILPVNPTVGSPQTIYRMSQGAASAPVFQAPQVAGLRPFAISSPVVASTGNVYVYDRSQTFGVVSSPDAGAHWLQRSTGLVSTSDPPQSGTGTAVDQHLLVFAPSDPATGYLAIPLLAAPAGITGVAGAPASLLYRTTNGGTTWTQLQPAPGVVSGVAIDPQSSSHVVVGLRDTPALWETFDEGHAWRLVTTPTAVLSQPLEHLYQVFFSHSASGIHIYIQVSDSVGFTWLRGDESSAGHLTWKPLDTLSSTSPSDSYTQSSLAVDPLGDSAVAAYSTGMNNDRHVQLWSTRDGFDTTSTTSLFVARPLPQASADANYVTVELDHQGDGFLWLGDSWFITTCNSSSATCRISTMLAFRVATIGQVVTTTASAGSSSAPQSVSNMTSSGTIPVPPARDAGAPRATCQLPSVLVGQSTQAAPPAAPPVSSSAADSSGTLTFDGTYLDYTLPGEPYRGLIGRINPATCRPGATVALVRADFPAGQLPELEELSYDPSYRFPDGSQGAILAAGLAGQDTRLAGSQTPIYSINPANGHTMLLYGISADGDAQRNLVGNGDPFFAYDFFSGLLWHYAYQGDTSTQPGLTTLSDDRGLSTCMTYFVDYVEPSADSNAEARNIGGWTVGGRHIMYLSLEDDRTVLEVDSDHCTILDAFQHAYFGEPTEENEQMACDGVTFAHPGDAGNVLWFRDDTSNRVVAFALPNGSCPMPSQPPDASSVLNSQNGGAVLPSQPVGTITLPGIQAGQPPQLQGTGQTQVVTQTEVQSQAQAEAQSQAQSQAQAVTQLQPGVAVQRQRRAQVAVREQGTAVNVAYHATDWRRSTSGAVGVLAALLTAGLGLLARRPRWATSRSRGRV